MSFKLAEFHLMMCLQAARSCRRHAIEARKQADLNAVFVRRARQEADAAFKYSRWGGEVDAKEIGFEAGN